MVVVLVPGLAAVPLAAKGLGAGTVLSSIPLGSVSPASCSYDASSSQSREDVGQCRSVRGRGPLLIRARGSSTVPRGSTKASASRWLEYVVTKPKLRKRRRGKGDDSDGDDGFGGGGFGGGGSWGGGHGDYGGYSGGDNWGNLNQFMYELSWAWPVLVAASVLHTLTYLVEDSRRHLRLRPRSAA